MIQTVNNNLFVLPFYTSIEMQNHRKPYAFGAVYPLIAPTDRLLPFQIIRAVNSANLISCDVYNLKGTCLFSIGPELKETGFEVKKYEDSDSLIYYGDLPLSFKLPEGQYYLVLSDGKNTWYSDIFTAINSLSHCIKLEWWDDTDLVFDSGRVVYDNRFINTVYLQTNIGKPEYMYEEEGETRDGYFFPEVRLSEKKYKFVFTASEFLCDALRLVTISDHVRITDNYGRIYDCDAIKFEVEWQEQGDIASVTTSFETNTVIKKIGKGYSRIISGDFNKDFNNDFKTT